MRSDCAFATLDRVVRLRLSRTSREKKAACAAFECESGERSISRDYFFGFSGLAGFSFLEASTKAV